MGRLDVSPGVSLSYCIFRPRQLHDVNRPPLVVVHGGPSIPSNYLLPIVNGVTDRSVIFYDQYGCGKSSRPPVPKHQRGLPPFSIHLMVQHLQLLITKEWKLQQYFLLGHSFGGILAYEYLLGSSSSTTATPSSSTLTASNGRGACQGLILASAPTSSKLIQNESKRLYRSVNGLSSTSDSTTETATTTQDDDHIDNDNDDPDNNFPRTGENHFNNGGDVDEDDEEDEDKQRLYEYSEIFRQTHECRLSQPPLALVDALAQAGPTPWRGIPAIPNYQATQPLSSMYLPTLLLRGEYDFCTDRCMEGWDDLLLDPPPKRVVLTNCSHYSMLEDERQFGIAIKDFLDDVAARRKEGS